MTLGNFYFINDSYYEKFKGCNLMENKDKEIIDNNLGGRPCFYAFKEKESNIYWMIPFSSRIEKFEKEYNVAIKKFGFCDGIVFGYILGERKAFLVQNMCPVTDNYHPWRKAPCFSYGDISHNISPKSLYYIA